MRKLQIKQGLNRAISACASGVGVSVDHARLGRSPVRQRERPRSGIASNSRAARGGGAPPSLRARTSTCTTRDEGHALAGRQKKKQVGERAQDRSTRRVGYYIGGSAPSVMPEVPCRLGTGCTRDGCHFAHPNGRVCDGSADGTSGDGGGRPGPRGAARGSFVPGQPGHSAVKQQTMNRTPSTGPNIGRKLYFLSTGDENAVTGVTIDGSAWMLDNGRVAKKAAENHAWKWADTVRAQATPSASTASPAQMAPVRSTGTPSFFSPARTPPRAATSAASAAVSPQTDLQTPLHARASVGKGGGSNIGRKLYFLSTGDENAVTGVTIDGSAWMLDNGRVAKKAAENHAWKWADTVRAQATPSASTASPAQMASVRSAGTPSFFSPARTPPRAATSAASAAVSPQTDLRTPMGASDQKQLAAKQIVEQQRIAATASQAAAAHKSARVSALRQPADRTEAICAGDAVLAEGVA
eukprot:COSAG03_NODE_1236_length_4499_cov_56.967500_5_plen_469_part_00